MPEPEAAPESNAGPESDTGSAQSWTARHPGFTYTGARLLIFAVVFALCAVVIGNTFVALMTAAIVSSIASIFLLRKQRDALSASIASRAERANSRMAERAASEDNWDDSQRGDTNSDVSDSGRS